ncbi:MAG: hypothetical protein SGI92_03205 [Bryobacteraceae bacterium]|nr:hypothetical protein [Bryobacteraceae bacterium]
MRLAFDAKGEKLCVGIGSASSVSPGEPEQRTAISRCNPDGSIYFHPATGRLWASVQERDELGDDLAPDYLTHI